MASFEGLGVRPEIIASLMDMDWNLAREVQEEAIPMVLGGSDAVISAPTGSGKTGALSIPVLQVLYETLLGVAGTNNDPNQVDLSTLPPWTFVPNASRCSSPVPPRLELVALDDTNISTGNYAWGLAQSIGAINISKQERPVYFEMTFEDFDIARLGFSLSGQLLGTTPNSYGLGSTGKRSTNNAFEDAPNFCPGDTVGLLLDPVQGSIGLTINGQQQPDLFRPGEVARFGPNKQQLLQHVSLSFKGKGFAKVNGSGPFAWKSLPSSVVPLWNLTPESSVPVIEEPVRGGGKNKKAQFPSKNAPEVLSPLAVVLQPTRELAIQFCGELRKMSKYLVEPPVTVALRCADADVAAAGCQVEASRANAHILVATVRSCQILLKSGELKLDKANFLLLDEADDILGDPSTRAAALSLRKLISPRAQVVLCSATMLAGDPSAVNQLCSRPQRIDLSSDSLIPDTVEQLEQVTDPSRDLTWVPSEWGSDDFISKLLAEVFLQAANAGAKEFVVSGQSPSGVTTTASGAGTADAGTGVGAGAGKSLKKLKTNPSTGASTSVHIPPPSMWSSRSVLLNCPSMVSSRSGGGAKKGMAQHGNAKTPNTVTRPTVEWVSDYTDQVHMNLIQYKIPSAKSITSMEDFVQDWANDLYQEACLASTNAKPKNQPRRHGFQRNEKKSCPDVFNNIPVVRLARELISLGTKVMKLLSLAALIDRLQPSQAMIFCRTRLECDITTNFLLARNLNAVTLHSTIGKGEGGRSGVITRFREGQVRFVVSTDVGARGVDIKGLPLVVSLTQSDATSYVHRVGRTGRAGRPGFAVSIMPRLLHNLQAPIPSAPAYEKMWFHDCKSASTCANSSEPEAGGCTIWADEHQIIEDVSNELGGSVVLPSFSPQDLENGPDFLSAIARRGQSAGTANEKMEMETSKQHVAIMKPFAQELYSLELKAQKSYSDRVDMSQKWRDMLKSNQ